jgi:hypothetical protein
VLYIYTSWLNLKISKELTTEILGFVYKTSCSQDFLGGYKSFLHRTHKTQYKFNYPLQHGQKGKKKKRERDEVEIKNERPRNNN